MTPESVVAHEFTDATNPSSSADEGCPVSRATNSTTTSPSNTLYYGDNLDVIQKYLPDESVDLIYLDPPFQQRPGLRRFPSREGWKIDLGIATESLQRYLDVGSGGIGEGVPGRDDPGRDGRKRPASYAGRSPRNRRDGLSRDDGPAVARIEEGS